MALNILMIFDNVLLAIITNIPMRLLTGFVSRGHIQYGFA